jgi:hypothetical protein
MADSALQPAGLKAKTAICGDFSVEAPRFELGTSSPVRFANSGGVVFVDESAQQVAAVQAGAGVRRRWTAAVGRQELERSIRPVLVVLAAVDAEHTLELAALKDEDPVEAVGANGGGPTARRRRWRSAPEVACG